MGDKESILFDLVKQERWDEINMRLQSDTSLDINIRDNNNKSLLVYFTLFHKIDLIKVLLTRNVKLDYVDSQGHTILHIIIDYGYEDIATVILDYNRTSIGISILDIRDNTGASALHYAIRKKNINFVKMLISYGADTNAIDKNGYNSLHVATQTRSIEMVNVILNHIGNINVLYNEGETALHMATSLKLVDICHILLEAGADPNIQNTEHDITPLHYAAAIGDDTIIKLLFEYGADPNIQNMLGTTVLHQCAAEGNFKTFQTIYLSKSRHTVNLSLVDINNRIPLHYILSNQDNIRGVEHLMEDILTKSSLIIRDINGISPLYYLIIYKMWKQYQHILIKKKLDIFAPIPFETDRYLFNLISKTDLSDFVGLVVASYLDRLRRHPSLWPDKIDAVCARELGSTKFESQVTFDRYCHDHIKRRLLKQMADPNISCSNFSYPKKNNTCIDVEEGVPVGFCTFTGTTLDVLIGLIYLLQKHSMTCSILSRDFAVNKELCKFYKSLGVLINTRCEFLNFELVWVYGRLYLVNDFKKLFNRCIDSQKKFVIIPLGIELPQGSHSNYLIYHIPTKTLERFEPYGARYPPNFNYNSKMLDELLEQQFKSIISDIQYIRPQDYMPNVGFQLLETIDKKHKRIGDPLGFCSIWSIWYVDMRITYSDIDRKQLVKYLLKTMNSKQISFRNTIRNYSRHITDLRDSILYKVNLDINDWLNDMYTDSQVDLLISEISKQIANIGY